MDTGIITTIASALVPFTWWQIVVVLLTAGVVIGGLLILLNKITGGNFKLFNFITARRKKKHEKFSKENKPSPHSICRYRYGLAYTITKIIDYSIQIHDIRTREVLSLQMLKAEEFMLNLKNMSLTAFSEKLKEKNIDCPPAKHPDYFNFKWTLHECFVIIKDIVKTACIKNGFDNMDSSTYDKYSDELIDRIEHTIETFFIENYLTYTIMSPEEIMMLHIKDGNTTLLKKFIYSFKCLFQVMRMISKDKGREITALNEKIKDIYEKELGLNFDEKETEP